MPRQTLTKTAAPGPNPTAGVAITMTAEDVSNHSAFVWTGFEIVIVQNTDTGAQTWTLSSVADPFGRTKDITTESIAAGAIRVVDCLSYQGWIQNDGMVYLAASSALVKFGVIVTKGRAT